jgi:hypothetical protein
VAEEGQRETTKRIFANAFRWSPSILSRQRSFNWKLVAFDSKICFVIN